MTKSRNISVSGNTPVFQTGIVGSNPTCCIPFWIPQGYDRTDRKMTEFGIRQMNAFWELQKKNLGEPKT